MKSVKKSKKKVNSVSKSRKKTKKTISKRKSNRKQEMPTKEERLAKLGILSQEEIAAEEHEEAIDLELREEEDEIAVH